MLTGRVKGAISDDGRAYEVRQGDTLLKSIPIDEARDDRKLAAAIKRNGWEALA